MMEACICKDCQPCVVWHSCPKPQAVEYRKQNVKVWPHGKDNTTRTEARELYRIVFNMVDRVHGGEKAGLVATTIEHLYYSMVEHDDVWLIIKEMSAL